jgi:hypothetical protein
MSLCCGKSSHVCLKSSYVYFMSVPTGFKSIQSSIGILSQLDENLKGFLQSSQARMITDAFFLQPVDIGGKLRLLPQDKLPWFAEFLRWSS